MSTGLPAPLPPITGVRGGQGGVEAERAAVWALAGDRDDAAARAREWAGLGPRTVADPDLLATGLLSPATLVEAELRVLAATTGPQGALGRAAAWEVEAVAVRLALAEIDGADRLAEESLAAVEYTLGHAAGSLAGAAVAGVASAWPGLVLADRLGVLAPALGAAGRVAEQQAIAHPGVVEHGFAAGGGLVDGLLGLPPLHLTTGDGAEAVAGLYDDGRPQVRRLRPEQLAALANHEGVSVPPAPGRASDLAALVATLGGVAGLSRGASSALNGTIAVTTLRRPGQPPVHVVYLPGTDDMTTTPGSQDADIRDMGTNLDLMAGRPTSYEQGVVTAMHEAGIGPRDPVLVVGHSQGGMVAGALAADRTPFHVTHVVTAGSPLAQVDLSPGVQAISLENAGDVVPLTDGAPNRASVGHVTVGFEAGGQGVVGHHSYDAYVAGAAAADASRDPSIGAALDSLHAAGFLGDGDGVDADTQVFQIARR